MMSACCGATLKRLAHWTWMFDRIDDGSLSTHSERFQDMELAEGLLLAQSAVGKMGSRRWKWTERLQCFGLGVRA